MNKKLPIGIIIFFLISFTMLLLCRSYYFVVEYLGKLPISFRAMYLTVALFGTFIGITKGFTDWLDYLGIEIF